MKFSTIVLSALGFAALSLADTTDSAPTPTQTSSYPTAVVACLDGCNPSDATCQAKCLGSAAPDDVAVNRTHDCVEKCDKGDGSAAATEKYSSCVQSCISTIFMSSATVGPTGGSGSGPSDVATATNEAGPSGSSGSHPTASGSGSPSGTSSGADASSSASGNGAGSVQACGSFLALFGVAAGVLAL